MAHHIRFAKAVRSDVSPCPRPGAVRTCPLPPPVDSAIFEMWLGSLSAQRGFAVPVSLNFGVEECKTRPGPVSNLSPGVDTPACLINHPCTVVESGAIKASMRGADRHSILQAVQRLSEVLGVRIDPASVRFEPRFGGRRVDAVVEGGPLKFAMEWRASGSLGHVFHAVHQVRAMASDLPDSMIPLLAVPFMGESARAYCEETGIAWLDLSGNAKITGPGLYIHALGHDNRFRRPGRVESAFGPKGSRVARWMLMNPGRAIRQRALATATGLNEGYVSRVVSRLMEMGLLERDDRGIQVVDAERLLDAWRDDYRFERHVVMQGHIAVAAGESVVQKVAHALDHAEAGYAVTGLAAAWYWTRYAGYRLSTVYLSESPPVELLGVLGFRETQRGSNTWLVVPRDEGVFNGVSKVDGIYCAHPVQVYLDLKSHPERAAEAAEEIRSRLILRNDRDQ